MQTQRKDGEKMKIPFLRNKDEHNSGKGQENFIPSESEVAVIERCTVPGTEMPDLDTIFEEAGILQAHGSRLREIISAKRFENAVKGIERHA